jgi:hypothetical protein
VRERLYRGPCLPEPQIAAIVARFVDRRDAIHALYDSLPALDRGYARHAVQYLDEFYDAAKDPRGFARTLRDACQPGS